MFISPHRISVDEQSLGYSGRLCFQNQTFPFVNYCTIRDTLNSAVKVVRDKRHLRELHNV